MWNKRIHPKTNREIDTFSLITTEANPLSASIHNGGNNAGRMPLILSVEDEEKWLDPYLDKQVIKSLFKTPADNNMEAYKVTPDFRFIDPHNSDIIKKVA